MRKRYKPYKAPLSLKIIIAVTFWGLSFSAVSFIFDNPIYLGILWIIALLIILYNVWALVVNDVFNNKPKIDKNDDIWAI